MAWSRSKRKYEIAFLGPTKNPDGTPVPVPSVAIQGLWYGPDSFFDWKSRTFVQAQPKQLTQDLALRAMPVFPGVVQRWCYELDTHDFPDGDFVIYLVKGGSLTLSQPEAFSVYKGSAIGIIPVPVPGTDG